MAKFRQDFVTNSSSSSFIIACNKIPSDMHEAAEIWFGDQKDYIGPIIIQGLFNGLSEFKVDFDKLLDKAKNDKLSRYDYGDSSSEDTIISELFSNFSFEEEYGPGWCYDSRNPTAFKKYEEQENQKLLKKFPEAKNIYQIPYSERASIEDAWYKKPKVRARFVEKVQDFIDTFKGFDCLMTGSFADEDGELGSELEHGSHWDRFPEMIRFSHH